MTAQASPIPNISATNQKIEKSKANEIVLSHHNTPLDLRNNLFKIPLLTKIFIQTLRKSKLLTKTTNLAKDLPYHKCLQNKGQINHSLTQTPKLIWNEG